MNDFLNINTVSISEDGSKLIILDQTLLPREIRYINLDTEESIWEAIYSLRVRGAPAIGVAAAYGLFVLINNYETDSSSELMHRIVNIKEYLKSARPTAVNLFWALDRMERRAKACFAMCSVYSETAGCYEDENSATKNNTQLKDVDSIKRALRDEAKTIHDEDIKTCNKIGENGVELLRSGMSILTHCNAGALATTGCGTALAPIYVGMSKRMSFRVFVDETRPLLQGARLTAFELNRAGVDVSLICDNMAASLMRKGMVDAVITGADRIAINGDCANKIGTAGLAVLAKEYGIPMYICAPISTIDTNCLSEKDIIIEERPGEEIYKMWFSEPVSVDGIKTYNPAFDVTENKYITAIITDKGVIHPPYEKSISELLNKNI